MAKTNYFAIRLGERKYLQGIELNNKAPKDPRAPTMGTRYTHSDYKTIWSNEPKLFEPLTAANYLKIIFEEFRWEERKLDYLHIVPSEFIEMNNRLFEALNL